MRCLHNGLYELRLVVCEEFACYLQERGHEYITGCGPDDYANALLNTAITSEIEDMEQKAALASGDIAQVPLCAPCFGEDGDDDIEIDPREVSELIEAARKYDLLSQYDDDIPF